MRAVASLPTVLVVGDLDCPEFADLLAPLDGTSTTVVTQDWATAFDYLSGSISEPDLVVIAQNRPGEVDIAAVEKLRALVPLTRIHAVLGSWCEGETRTGKPWPGVISCFWHEWRNRWNEELKRLEVGHSPLWELPVTATEEDRLLARNAEELQRRNGAVVVIAETRETASGLVDACRTLGFKAIAIQRDQKLSIQGLVAVIWDTTAVQAGDEGIVSDLRSRFPGAPITATLTFPRVADVARIRALGIAAVVAKPFLLEDLLAGLSHS